MRASSGLSRRSCDDEAGDAAAHGVGVGAGEAGQVEGDEAPQRATHRGVTAGAGTEAQSPGEVGDVEGEPVWALVERSGQASPREHRAGPQGNQTYVLAVGVVGGKAEGVNHRVDPGHDGQLGGDVDVVGTHVCLLLASPPECLSGVSPTQRPRGQRQGRRAKRPQRS